MQSKSRLTDFDIQTKLGSGSYGVIYRVVRKSDKKVYVLKQINLSGMKEKMRKNSINEASILSKLQNPFVVRYYESFIDQNSLNIIMEYCDGGDLSLMLKQQTGRPLKQQKIWKIFLQICVGLEYIHSKRILHRDIKTLNIFLMKDETVKIGDLGVAKMLHQSSDFAQTMVGTPFYLSPQLCQEKPYNEKSDIWALGCLLYEMCTYKHPFEAANQGSLILKIVRGRYNPISDIYSKELRQTVDSCLERDYKRRPTVSVLLSRPFLKQKYDQLGVKQLVQKFEGQEGKRLFTQQLQKDLNKKEAEQSKQVKVESRQLQTRNESRQAASNHQSHAKPAESRPADPRPLPHKASVQKVFEEVKVRKQDHSRQQKKEQNQKKEEQRREQQLKKDQQRREQIRKEQLKREEALKKEEQKRKQEVARRQQELAKKQEQILKKQQIKREQAQKQQALRDQAVKDQAAKQAAAKQEAAKMKSPEAIKVRYEKEVNPKVYEPKKPTNSQSKEIKKPAPTPKLLNDSETPAPRISIKSKGFSIQQKQYYLPDISQPSSVKQTEKKISYNSEKKLIHHSASQEAPKQNLLKKRNSEPKVLFGSGALPVGAPPLPSRVRKGAPIEKSRNSQRPIRPKPYISDEDKRQVADLPDSQSSDSQNQQMKESKPKTPATFRLKQVDDNEVLKRYQQLVQGKDTDISGYPEDVQIFETVKEEHEEDHNDQEPMDHSVSDEPDYLQHVQETQQAIQQPQQQTQMQQTEQSEEILEEPCKFTPEPYEFSFHQKQQKQWQFDEQPELPEFEQANPLLMEPEEDQNETRNYLQAKLQENIKRQDELNQLMQLKIEECKKILKSNYDQVIQFFRNKINMDSEYNEDDDKEVNQYLRSKKLTDAKKFQNIYKIIHFEIELENCRNIIQSICKKLSQLDK